MNRAVELAKECGAKGDVRITWYDTISDTEQKVTQLFGVFMTPAQVEAFYHTARAEALMEAAEVFESPYVAAELRAMADREGK